MHRSSIFILGTVAITLSGCSGQKENKIPNFESTSKPENLAKNSNLETGTKLASLAQYPLNTQNIADLIPSTEINKRLKEVEYPQSNSDPFAPLFTTAKIVTKVQKPNPSTEVATTAPKQKLPPLPTVEPSVDTAKKVLVQGVMQIGERLHAIVKLPEDRTSRYVGEGEQYGNISIKRIEIKPDSEPLVFIEENGIEIPKAINDTTAKPQDKAQTPEKNLISLNTTQPKAKPEATPGSSLRTNRSPVSNLEVLSVPSSPPPLSKGSLSINSPKSNLTIPTLPTNTQTPPLIANQLPQQQPAVNQNQLISQLRKSSSLRVLPPSPLLEPTSQRLSRQKLKSMLIQSAQVQKTHLQQTHPKMSSAEDRQQLLIKLRQLTSPETSIDS